MNYIEANLQPGEEIKYVAKLHFFLFMQPIILLLIGAFLASSPKEISAMTRKNRLGLCRYQQAGNT